MWASIKDNNKDDCCWDNTPFNNGKKNYDKDAWEANKTKVVDKNRVLLPENDAATVLLGNNWSIPTEDDFTELIEETRSEWTKYNDVSGCMLTSKKNNETLFIPCAGYRDGGITIDIGEASLVWSSSISPDKPNSAIDIEYNGNEIEMFYTNRYFGLNIRPIYKKK